MCLKKFCCYLKLIYCHTYAFAFCFYFIAKVTFRIYYGKMFFLMVTVFILFIVLLLLALIAFNAIHVYILTAFFLIGQEKRQANRQKQRHTV